ncbi:MAG TPA: aldo/keto reductase [Micromonosporaceae bacterium]|nr:aldo/keto reductase [Micromonosporaceae bacterium]
MRERFLGASGVKVSEVCLGAGMFGDRTDEATGVQILDRFADAGGTLVDTADVYTGGQSEEIIGRWLRGRVREDVVLATKVRWGSGGNREGLSRKHILAAAEASLRRLGTDHIDLYQIHGWDDGAPLTETLWTLDTLVRAGKVRYVGVSNYCGWQLQKAVDLCQAHGWQPPVLVQMLYNLLDREAEWELLPVCRNEGLGVLTWSSLRAGWLAGGYRRGMAAPAPESRVRLAAHEGWPEQWDNYATEHTWRVLDEVHAIAAETGRTAAQVSLRWLLQRPGITAPVVGPRTVEQLTDCLGALGWSLTTDQVDRLTAASDRNRLPYPYDLQAGGFRRSRENSDPQQ